MLDRQDRDSSTLIYSFLTNQELAKMALVSKKQQEESEKEYYWKSRVVIVNGQAITSKLGIMLFHELQRRNLIYLSGEQYHFYKMIKVPGGPPLLKTIGDICLDEPELARRIMAEPVFRNMLNAGISEQTKSKRENRIFRKMGGAIAGALLGTIGGIVSSACWLAYHGISLGLFSIPYWATNYLALSTTPLRWICSWTIFPPLLIVGSFFYGLYAGWKNGFSGAIKSMSDMQYVGRRLCGGKQWAVDENGNLPYQSGAYHYLTEDGFYYSRDSWNGDEREDSLYPERKFRFKLAEKLNTVADIAADAEQARQKRGLQLKPNAVLPSICPVPMIPSAPVVSMARAASASQGEKYTAQPAKYGMLFEQKTTVSSAASSEVSLEVNRNDIMSLD